MNEVMNSDGEQFGTTRKTCYGNKYKYSILSNIMKKFVKKLIKWSANTKIFALPWRLFENVVIDNIQNKGAVILYYSDAERHKVIDLINKIKGETELLLGINEAYQIFMAVKRTEKVKGDIAEVGAYKGGSAKLICEVKGNKPLHLFDTFEGIPKVDEIDTPQFYKGQYAASVEAVKNYLKKYKKVYFYKGVFPATVAPIKDKRFSFVHFDVDTYESTINCLKFFYSRMSKGGIIISHDYFYVPGVRRAFDEFFKDKSEPIIEMSGSQCLVVKV